MNESNATLHDLLQHPGWPILEARFQARRSQRLDSLARSIMAQDGPLDQRAIDEERGFWRGARYFMREAKLGAAAFERDIKDGEE